MRLKDLVELLTLPRITVDLMHEKTQGNHPFYSKAVKCFYEEAVAPHPKWPLAKQYQYGCSICEFPRDFDTYFRQLDSSARNNYRKAIRKGYAFRRFDFNAHLHDVREIWKSCSIRQGQLPAHIARGQVDLIENPPSTTLFHDYPYFGVFLNDTLVSYGACLVAGNVCSFHDLLGHARHLENGVVPMTIIDVAREVLATYPTVKYFGYGTHYGASETLRRFKQKFRFNPYRVTWKLRSVSKERQPVLSGNVT